MIAAVIAAPAGPSGAVGHDQLLVGLCASASCDSARSLLTDALNDQRKHKQRIHDDVHWPAVPCAED